MRVGIFGGSFNPPHMGHINSLQTVIKKAGLDQIRLVPATQNPLKLPVEGPTTQQRLEMTQHAIHGYGPQFVVDDQEIVRGGKSFTIDTIKNMRKEIQAEDLFLIIGADHFSQLHLWKDYKKILSEANLIVTTRPGYDFPTHQEDLPEFIKELVAEYDFNFIELSTGRNIQFITLKDVDVASSELRRKLRLGQSTNEKLPLSVEKYIRENRLYRNVGERIQDYLKFTEFCGHFLFSKKAIAVKGFDLTKLSSPSEFAVVASGSSTRHASALAGNLILAVKEEFGIHPQSLEGVDEGRWVVIDYGSLIIHLFYDFVRQEYALEKIWKDAVDLGLKDITL
jgi:nicotinate-nucleotide adenylyltransferase